MAEILTEWFQQHELLFYENDLNEMIKRIDAPRKLLARHADDISKILIKCRNSHQLTLPEEVAVLLPPAKKLVLNGQGLDGRPAEQTAYFNDWDKLYDGFKLVSLQKLRVDSFKFIKRFKNLGRLIVSNCVFTPAAGILSLMSVEETVLILVHNGSMITGTNVPPDAPDHAKALQQVFIARKQGQDVAGLVEALYENDLAEWARF